MANLPWALPMDTNISPSGVALECNLSMQVQHALCAFETFAALLCIGGFAIKKTGSPQLLRLILNFKHQFLHKLKTDKAPRL